MSTRPVAPFDRYTRHRLHWIKGNDCEVWEWLRNGTWLRPGCEKPMSEAAAASLGMKYLFPAIPLDPCEIRAPKTGKPKNPNNIKAEK